MVQACTGIQLKTNATVEGFPIFSSILASWVFIIIGLMIAIKLKPHAENDINQHGPKNLDSFWLNSLIVGLAIYFLFSKHYLERYRALWIPITGQYVTILIENIYFSIPEEKWYTYPAWLFLHIQVIIIPVIWFSAISTKILMRNEMKRYLFGNRIHPVHE